MAKSKKSPKKESVAPEPEEVVEPVEPPKSEPEHTVIVDEVKEP